MQGETLQQHARDRAEGLPGAGLTHPFGPDREVFTVRDKVFMLLTDITRGRYLAAEPPQRQRS